jgi:hypothetical protein
MLRLGNRQKAVAIGYFRHLAHTPVRVTHYVGLGFSILNCRNQHFNGMAADRTAATQRHGAPHG